MQGRFTTNPFNQSRIMPDAIPFQTLGAGNGFPSCVQKINVLDNVGDGSGSEYDYWTTFGGYNKDSADDVTQEQIHDSLTAAMKLYWNLNKVTLATGYVGLDTLDEVIVSGWDATGFDPEPDPIEPKDRACGGVLTRGGDTAPNLGDVDLRLDTGFSRMYKGDTTNENNFIGYGGAFISTVESFDPNGTIGTIYIPIGGDPSSHLGGYSTNNFSSERLYEYAYIELGGIHFLWLGSVDSSPTDPDTDEGVDSATLKAWFSYTPSGAIEQARITGLEFYTYP